MSDNLQWDDTINDIYGYGPGQSSGSFDVFKKTVHPDDRENLWNKINEAIKLKLPFVADHRIIRQDRKISWIQCSGMAFYDEASVPYLMIGTTQDITERKQFSEDQAFLNKISDLLSNSFDYVETLQSMSVAATDYFCDGCFIDHLHSDGKIDRIVAIHPDPEGKDRLLSIHKNFTSRYEKDHPLVNVLISGKPSFCPEVNDIHPHLKLIHGEEYVTELVNLNFKSLIASRLKVERVFWEQ